MENQKVNKYNNSLVYKLVCKDINVKNVYVGSTCSYRLRQNNHKHNTTNPNGKKYNQYVYQIIRLNGGWENWDMVLIERCNVNDKLELLKIERNKMEELNADLNKCIPSRTQAEWKLENAEKLNLCKKTWSIKVIVCECGCNITQQHLGRHKTTEKHKKHMENINIQIV